MYNKALQTKDSAYIHALTRSYSDEKINNFYNDVDETLWKPSHYTIVMGDFKKSKREKKKLNGNGKGQIWARIENRKRRPVGRMDNIKKVQNHEYHVPEDSRYEMDVESQEV